MRELVYASEIGSLKILSGGGRIEQSSLRLPNKYYGEG